MAARTVIVLHPFDASAGAQRVAAAVVAALRGAGRPVRLWLGFGNRGFVTDAVPDWTMLAIDTPRWRKLLYPLWLLMVWLALLRPLLSGARLWANSFAALPAALPYVVFAPRRLVVHLHELGQPALLMWLAGVAARRGARLVAVSRYHATRLGMATLMLPNAVGADPPPAPARRERLVFVGVASAMKGWPLFLAIVRALGPEDLQPVAFLAARPRPPTPADLADAAAAGIRVVIGVTDPAEHWHDAFLGLQLTDPGLADETFALVAAEAIWHLVPVGGAGAAVLDEVAGAALAFNDASRDPAVIAAAIRALRADPDRHARLVLACAGQRTAFANAAFAAGVLSIVDG